MTDQQVDLAALDRRITSCRGSHAALVAHLDSLPDVDPRAPSVLPAWSIGHVMSHVARNGDSHLDMLGGRPQYPSVEARDAGIERGAGRPWAEQVADVAATATAVDEAFATHDNWTGVARTLAGERRVALLPLLRQREVEVHRADLGLGYGFDDMPTDYVRDDLRLLEMTWAARKPMGMTTLPDAALAVAPSTRLAWLIGRVEIEGLGQGGVF